jgi:hypothetical protein
MTDPAKNSGTLNSDTSILTLTNTQAKELAGRAVTIGGARYHFKNYEPRRPGHPPWRSGAEGKAYPLVGVDGAVAAYLKFFTYPTQKRLNRTAWLIGQQMHTWLPNLAAAPLLWTDSRRGLPGAKIDFQFAAYLAKAVAGETWLELKSGIAGGGTRFSENVRWRCVKDLLLALASLERAELVHGDLSPNKVVIDLNARADEAALYLIDFDAFFSNAAGADQAVTIAEGGTYGTDGYCPPDLVAAAAAGDGSAAPYSDRCGRDMLLLEFLVMGQNLPADDPLAHWNYEQLRRQFQAWQARNDPKCVRVLRHLDPAVIFKLSELERPTSVDLAIGLGLSLAERRVLRRVTELPQPTPALLGDRPTRAELAVGSLKLVIGAEGRGQRLSRPHALQQLKSKWNSADDWGSFIAILVALLILLLASAVLVILSDKGDRSKTEPVNLGIPYDRNEDANHQAIRRSIEPNSP